MNKLKLTYQLGVYLLNLISKSWRIKIYGNFPKCNGVVAFWHSQMLPAWFAFNNKNASAIVSASSDGNILSHLLKMWKFEVVRGSSSKGGKDALNNMIKSASEGKFVLITPDGPQGPALKMKAGAIITAQRAAVPLYLCSVDIKSKFTFVNSWDKFQLPLPFSRIEIKYSEPFLIPKSAERNYIDNLLITIENDLNNL